MDSLPLPALAVAAVAVAGAAFALTCKKRGKPAPALVGEKVANLNDIPKGTMQQIDVDDDGKRVILLSHLASGKVTATSAKCTHFGVDLVKGVLSGDRIVCPWHAACFNAETGDIEDGPVLDKLVTFPTVVDPRSGDIYVDLGVAAGTAVPKRRTPAMCSHIHGTPAKKAQNFVIVGAGAAAAAAVEELRIKGYTGDITLIEKAGYLPYDRTKLSKNPEAEVSLLRPESFYTERGVTIRLNSLVTKVNTQDKTVTLASGELIHYDKLLCASGGPARTFRADRGETPAFDGADSKNIFALRDAPDATGLVGAIREKGTAARVVVLGSSFIGMEAAAWLVSSQKMTDVTVVGMEKEPFERVLGPEIGRFMRGIHASKGVKFIMESSATRFLSNAGGEVTGVILRSGQTLPADIVIIGAGMIPVVDYLRSAAGVQILARAPGGVQVDETLKAADDVYVAGDLAFFPYHGHGTRIEHWDVAMDQGRVAARNMLGEGVTYATVPFFWTNQYGKAVRYAGHATSYTEVIIHGTTTEGVNSSWTAYFVQNEKVAAVATWNNDPAAVAGQELLRLDALPLPATLRAATKFDLVAVLREATLRK